MPIQRTVLRNDDLNPDGVRVIVAWTDMGIGTSVFVPCVNTEEAKKQIKDLFRSKTWKPVIQVRVENSKLGVRVWRMT